MRLSKAELAKIIDSTNVKPTATRSEIEKLCADAIQYGFGCVCVNPVYVGLAAGLLKGFPVKVSGTVGFPFGSSLTEVKVFEAEKALLQGASELDMVINLSLLKSGDYAAVKHDIASVVNVKRQSEGVIVKVIIEAPSLTQDEKVSACRLASDAGADFVKTATGFLGGGATVEDVRLMRQAVAKAVGVKAAGGIRTLSEALAMIEAGANRIGTSSAVEILKGA
jgi:deoxyribose-phosphate aldolase